jgi:translation initiation factor RLI1
MPSKVALVNYNKCRPDQCDDGICKAALACKQKLLKQEKANEPPMNPFICRACGDCIRACPLDAIEIAKM